MSVTVYTSSARRSSWKSPLSGFEGGLTKLKPFDKLLEETLKDSTCKNLNDNGKEHVKKNLKRAYDLWNPANKRLIKSYNAVLEALNIMFDTNKNDPKLREQLSKLNTRIAWELCIDGTFVERLVLMANQCIEDNAKVIDHFQNAYNEALSKAFSGEGNGRGMFSAPASNCEMTGICHCNRYDNQPLNRSTCLMGGAILEKSAMEQARHEGSMFEGMGSIFDDEEDDEDNE